MSTDDTTTIGAYTAFWRAGSPFSQWHPSRFEVDGHRFGYAEQYMMYAKATLFGDSDTAAAILASRSPREQKALGREVAPFDEDTWVARREDIVYRGNHAKFTQNRHLRDALLATAGTTLVEASPLDRIWGVGLAPDDPRLADPESWQGLNLLGAVLTRLRDDLLAAAG
jgi:hypothetical protein